MSQDSGFIASTVRTFVARNLAPLLAILSIVAGLAALIATPREEEPQIIVPMADVLVSAPGLSAREVERLVSTRMEKLLYQVDGVEYVYSTSRPNEAVVTVRFYVGQNLEDSLVRLHDKLATSADLVPSNVAAWVVKPVSIDDVPIVSVTLTGPNAKAADLRRLAEELELTLQSVPNTGRTQIIGGEPEILRIELDLEKMSAYGLTAGDVSRALGAANVRAPAGAFQQNNRHVQVDLSSALVTLDEVRQLVVSAHAEHPVYLRDVARIELGPDEPAHYTHIGFGPAGASKQAAGGSDWLTPAVTVTVAKRPGANAVVVSEQLQEAVSEFRAAAFPDDVQAHVTRDYGATANHKVNDLVESLAIAIVIVMALITMTLGWREAIVVVVSVPMTFGLTLLVNALVGYSINRVTLFALILALGLVVDDPITNVDNIQRHMQAAGKRSLGSVIRGVAEVLPPVIMSTLAIVVSFAPMFFITGMMGPYMAPMAINVPLAVLFSLVASLTVVPWLSYLLLRPWKGRRAAVESSTDEDGANEPAEHVRAPAGLVRIFRKVMQPLLGSRKARLFVLGGTLGAFVVAAALPAVGLVPLKLLPYDNRGELQLVVDMDEGTSLEQTMITTRALADHLRTVPEVTDFTTFVGTASPMDFNGLVRHYYFRRGSNVADIRVNLLDRFDREQQSHAIALRIRNELQKIAGQHGANLKIVEVPPGPPVLSTVTAEVYGEPHHGYDELASAAERVATMLRQERGIVDVDTTLETAHEKLVFQVDQEKAALNGVAPTHITEALGIGLGGRDSSLLHRPEEANPLPLQVRLPPAKRSSAHDLENLRVRSGDGGLVAIGELGKFQKVPVERSIYRKNMRPVVYVQAETAGVPPANAVLSMQKRLGEQPLPAGISADFAGEGEWKITIDVFRDLGIAFGIALLGIYILLVYETRNYVLPLVLMIAIPLTVIGIMPGFALLNLVSGASVGGYGNPVFFTATAMIGMIGLSGIVVRNSVVLITFIKDALEQGESIREAIIQAGAMRLRPIFLTAGTTALSALPITLDPVFSGLAWALIFGIIVSTAFTLVLVPIVYYMLHERTQRRLARRGASPHPAVASGEGVAPATP